MLTNERWKVHKNANQDTFSWAADPNRDDSDYGNRTFTYYKTLEALAIDFVHA